MKKNIIALILIISTFYTHTSPLRFLAKASVLSAAAIGVKGAFLAREKGSLVSDNKTFEQIKNSLNTERKLWNPFGFARRIFKSEEQPTMKTIVLKEESDGSRIVLERDSSIFGKNNGTLKKIDCKGKIINSNYVFGPMAKSDIGVFATSIALLLASSPFVAGVVLGSTIA